MSPPRRRARAELDERFDFANIIGSDPKMLRVLELIGRVAPTEASVLIMGESGTGKELVAEAMHATAAAAARPFVKVNLGGISSTLFESEMFGHVRGAFTDARQDRKGRFEVADGGTIFLDEIGEARSVVAGEVAARAAGPDVRSPRLQPLAHRRRARRLGDESPAARAGADAASFARICSIA